MVRYWLFCAIALLSILLIPPLTPADTILDDFQVNAEFPGHPPQKFPYAAARWETETIYVTWLSQRDGVHWDVGCNRFNYDLEPLGDAFYLNEPLGVDDCIAPRLALSAAGFGAAWIEDTSPHSMMFRSYDDNGNPFSPPVSVADVIADEDKNSLSIAALNDGYLLVWYDERDDSRIWTQKVNFDGDLIGGNFPIRPDSSGSILGLEAQNHPDGRVLVSWVTDQMYSRGRWLDHTGAALGDVFDMAEPWINEEIIGSSVCFDEDGYGMIWQHSNTAYWCGNEVTRKYGYKTYIDPEGIQTAAWIGTGFWYHYDGETPSGYQYTESYSFPDLVFLPDSNYVSMTYHRCHLSLWGGNEENNHELYSSVVGDFIVPWGVYGMSDYNLCQLDGNSVLYSFGVGFVGFRRYEIATLDSSDHIVTASEPAFGTTQHLSKICVHRDGDFRVIYNNHLDIDTRIYTRFFDILGNPITPDELLSKDIDGEPVSSIGGRMIKTADDNVLAVWPGNLNLYGTSFMGEVWEGEVHRFECYNNVSQWALPAIAVDDQNRVLIVWEDHWPSGLSYCQIMYAQHFNDLYTYAGPGYQIGPGDFYNCRIIEMALKSIDEYMVFYWMPFTLYNGNIGVSQVISNPSPTWFDIESDDFGYWLTMEYNGDILLQRVDSDGNFLGIAVTISDVSSIPLYKPPIAISDSSGNFAVCWQDARFDEGDIFCRQFASDGSFYGREYRVNSDSIGSLQWAPAVAFGPEDRLYFTWTDFRNEGGQGDIYCKVIEWEDATAVEPEDEPTPYSFALHPPYPNPFNPATTITFEIPVAGLVKLDVFDINGRRVGVLREASFEPGLHHIPFDGSNLASGIYFVRLQAGDFQQTQKLVLLK